MNAKPLFFSSILCISFLFVGCSKDNECDTYDQCKLEVVLTEVTEEGIYVEGKIKRKPKDEILEQGFEVTRTYTAKPNVSTPFSYTTKYIMEGDFRLSLESDLETDALCTIQAYLQMEHGRIVSDPVEVKPKGCKLPVIESISPSEGSHSSKFTIKGKNFSPCSTRNNVFLNGTQCNMISSSEEELVVRYEDSKNYLLTGPATITVFAGENQVKATDLYTVNGVKILAVSPSPILVNEPFEITLEKLYTTDKYTIKLDSYVWDVEILSIEKNTIKCILSEDYPTDREENVLHVFHDTELYPTIATFPVKIKI